MSDLQCSVARKREGGPTAGEGGGSQDGGRGKSEGIENRSHGRKELERTVVVSARRERVKVLGKICS